MAFFRLILTHGQGELAILVRDFCTTLPQARDAGDDDENGRHLGRSKHLLRSIHLLKSADYGLP